MAGARKYLEADEEIGLARKIMDGREASRRLEASPGLEIADAMVLEAAESAGEVARNELVARNIGLAGRVARGYLGLGIEYDDLVQAGSMGLMEAAGRFDPEQYGTRFSTYATWWVRQAILKLIGDAGFVRIPQSVNSLDRKFRRALEAWIQEHPGQVADEDTVRTLAEITDSQARSLRMAGDVRAVGFLGDPDEDGAREARSQEPEVSAALERSEIAAVLRREVGRLPLDLMAVAVPRFGLDGGFPATLEAIGDDLGITKEAARQRVGRAVDRLRSNPYLRDLVLPGSDAAEYPPRCDPRRPPAKGGR